MQRYKDDLQIREQIEDKGLPAPPRGSSEELQHLNKLQIQKYFTLAPLVLLVTNIMSDHTMHPSNYTWTYCKCIIHLDMFVGVYCVGVPHCLVDIMQEFGG